MLFIEQIFPVINSYFFTASGSNSTPKRRWSNEEKNTIFSVFKEFMNRKELPSLNDIQIAISNNQVLKSRTPPQVKTWINNLFLKDRRSKMRDS